MFLEVIKSPGLAQLSYLLGDEDAGECVVIDPRRDADIYLKMARERGCRLTAALETHIHADFVSGGRELQEHFGVPLYGGKSDSYGFEIQQVEDKQTLEVGKLQLRCLHTPGHSPEHMSYVVKGGDGAPAPWGVFTGDALFAGSVGRPDLAAGMGREELAEQLYDSVMNKLLQLGDGIIVYPGHGSGSPCGGSIGDRDQTSIGYEAANSEKLQAKNKQEFVKKVLDDLPDEPVYYERLKKLNADGAELTGGLPFLKPLTVEELADQSASKAVQLVDVREVADFGGGHVPGSINIAMRTSFPPWAGRILDPKVPILLVGAGLEDVDEAHTHLFRMGFDNVSGYLLGGIREWFAAGMQIGQTAPVSVQQLQEFQQEHVDMFLLDVRADDEWEQGHLPGANHIFAAHLDERLEEIPQDCPIVVYCGSDFRASIATSILKAKGWSDVRPLLGSVKAWKESGSKMVK